MSFLIYKIARLKAFAGVSFNKSGIISVRYKADILAIMLARIDQSLFFRHFPDLRLRHAAQGEQRMCKLLLRQAVEHITLVFLFIDGFFQEELSVLFFDSGIVSGYNVIVIQLLCPLHQLFKLHITVTVDTRIRSESVFIGADKAVHDLCAEIFRKIEHEIRNAQLTCNASCILHII